jgi:hypothetical protein
LDLSQLDLLGLRLWSLHLLGQWGLLGRSGQPRLMQRQLNLWGLLGPEYPERRLGQPRLMQCLWGLLGL